MALQNTKERGLGIDLFCEIDVSNYTCTVTDRVNADSLGREQIQNRNSESAKSLRLPLSSSCKMEKAVKSTCGRCRAKKIASLLLPLAFCTRRLIYLNVCSVVMARIHAVRARERGSISTAFTRLPRCLTAQSFVKELLVQPVGKLAFSIIEFSPY